MSPAFGGYRHKFGVNWRQVNRPDIPDWQSYEGALDESVNFLYQGICPISKATLHLPRTPTVERLARESARDLELHEGKMVGVLLVRDSKSQRLGYGRAFSGQLKGQTEVEGWVQPLHLPTPTPSEESTLQALAEWKFKLAALHQQLQDHPYHAVAEEWKAKEKSLREELRENKQERARQRQVSDLPTLHRQGRADSLRWRDFVRERKAALRQGELEMEQLSRELASGRARRKTLSQNLQAEMHQQMTDQVTSFLGCPPERLFPEGIPTGTGDCCAPKLLAWAARHELTPLAMAEVWWGPTRVKDKTAGEFYPPCRERCEALMGPLLSLALRPPIDIHYVDDQLVVADKPSGLLTVPGRYHWNQDSLLGRLSRRFPGLLPVHRLDLETSGLVVMARDADTQAALHRMFEKQQITKRYLARLDYPPEPSRGRIELALGPDQSGRYRVDPAGHPALTEYRRLDDELMELRPITGRSHQLRVHMAYGLGLPIRGDRLYSSSHLEPLRLHCSYLGFRHPTSGRELEFLAEPRWLVKDFGQNFRFGPLRSRLEGEEPDFLAPRAE